MALPTTLPSARPLTRPLATLARRLLPPSVIEWIQARVYGSRHTPAVGYVNFGSFRRLSPISRTWGIERGGAIDRYYIEGFLAAHQDDIRGHVLEIGEDRYTRQFGGERVTRSDVLDLRRVSDAVTIVADLTQAEHVPSDSFDCILLTQVLQVIDDSRAAIATVHRILKPGGVVLATLPGISQVRMRDWGGYWCGGFRAARKAFTEIFSPKCVETQVFGNVLVAIAFLQGLGVGELKPEELDHHDPDFELTICVRASKS